MEIDETYMSSNVDAFSPGGFQTSDLMIGSLSRPLDDFSQWPPDVVVDTPPEVVAAAAPSAEPVQCVPFFKIATYDHSLRRAVSPTDVSPVQTSPPLPFNSALVSPLAPSTLCLRCLDRLDAMRESDCQAAKNGARLWEANWASSGMSCFANACQCSQFCADHGRPLQLCLDSAPDERHQTLDYRGTWVLHREKRQGESAEAPASKEARRNPQPELPPRKLQGCVECASRLLSLTTADFVAGNPEAVDRILKVQQAALSLCQGFCSTPHCCKLHWCPATIGKDGTASRYRCSAGPHDRDSKKSRYHADFAFYCSDPQCCGGRWYSREDAHSRKAKKAADRVAPSIGQDQLKHAMGESSSMNRAGTVVSEPLSSDSAEQGAAERVPIVAGMKPFAYTVAPDLVAYQMPPKWSLCCRQFAWNCATNPMRCGCAVAMVALLVCVITACVVLPIVFLSPGTRNPTDIVLCWQTRWNTSIGSVGPGSDSGCVTCANQLVAGYTSYVDCNSTSPDGLRISAIVRPQGYYVAELRVATVFGKTRRVLEYPLPLTTLGDSDGGVWTIFLSSACPCYNS